MHLHKLFLLVLAVLLTSSLWADPQPATASAATTVYAAAAPSAPAFDVKAATDAYLATVPPDKKARSDAYFEGGYWMQLWDFLIGAVIAVFLMHTRLSARMRAWAARLSSWRGVQDLVYFLQFLAFIASSDAWGRRGGSGERLPASSSSP